MASNTTSTVLTTAAPTTTANVTTNATIETPGALVPYTVGGVVGLAIAWAVFLALFIFWLVSMRRRYKYAEAQEASDKASVELGEATQEADALLEKHKKEPVAPESRA